ncbi:MAG TPA: acyl carrier protein [Methylomirabilota bacterium]|nr:acyl carrier protein [Methylomirabilota bacterium]
MPAPPLSRMEPDEVARILTAFINTHVMARGRPMHPDDAFEVVGVDSMALLKILVFVEKRFGFWMPDEDLVEDNLTSPRALANYICRRGISS